MVPHLTTHKSLLIQNGQESSGRNSVVVQNDGQFEILQSEKGLNYFTILPHTE